MDEHQRGSCALMSPSIREHLVSRKGVNEGVKFEGQLLLGGGDVHVSYCEHLV